MTLTNELLFTYFSKIASIASMLAANNLVYGKNPLCNVDNFHISHL